MPGLPPPDVLDRRGRMNRLVISVLVGVVCGSGVYALTYALAGKDYEQGPAYGSTYHSQYAGRFMFYFTGMAFLIALLLTRALLERRAKRLEREAAVPKAEVRS